MHIRIRLITYGWMLLCLLATACTSIGFELPQGPQGPDGKSAYDLWKEEVEAGQPSLSSRPDRPRRAMS